EAAQGIGLGRDAAAFVARGGLGVEKSVVRRIRARGRAQARTVVVELDARNGVAVDQRRMRGIGGLRSQPVQQVVSEGRRLPRKVGPFPQVAPFIVLHRFELVVGQDALRAPT